MIDRTILVSTVDIIMTTSLVFQSLDEQPRIRLAEFESQVYDDAGSACADLFRHGLHSRFKYSTTEV